MRRGGAYEKEGWVGILPGTRCATRNRVFITREYPGYPRVMKFKIKINKKYFCCCILLTLFSNSVKAVAYLFRKPRNVLTNDESS